MTMVRQIYILLLATLGLLIGPTQSVAAVAANVEMTCCEQMAAEPCCDDSMAEEEDEGCDGDCDCAGCTCVVHLSSSPSFLFQIDDFSFIAFIEKAHTFFFLD